MSFGDITNVTTGEARLSYVHLFKPYAHNQGDKERFSCTILVPKSDTATKARIDAAIEAAKQKGVSGKWNGVCPPIVQTPVHDGGNVAFVAVMGEIDHQAQRVTSSGGNLHHIG